MIPIIIFNVLMEQVGQEGGKEGGKEGKRGKEGGRGNLGKDNMVLTSLLQP
jgi:hypothetical protein